MTDMTELIAKTLKQTDANKLAKQQRLMSQISDAIETQEIKEQREAGIK